MLRIVSSLENALHQSCRVTLDPASNCQRRHRAPFLLVHTCQTSPRACHEFHTVPTRTAQTMNFEASSTQRDNHLHMVFFMPCLTPCGKGWDAHWEGQRSNQKTARRCKPTISPTAWRARRFLPRPETCRHSAPPLHSLLWYDQHDFHKLSRSLRDWDISPFITHLVNDSFRDVHPPRPAAWEHPRYFPNSVARAHQRVAPRCARE